MKTNGRVLKRISADSYQIVNNNDNSIDLYFSEQLASELNINNNTHVRIQHESINDKIVVELILEN